jgi:crotonobetainyl-CoA:carnitine CoA-transferase CaiB-like acyl-CoA transferase
MPLMEPATENAPAFARARDARTFRELLATRMEGQSAADLERRLNAAGVPAARVRTLREFTREAVDTGLLQPVTAGEGEAKAIMPGLGWRYSPGSNPEDPHA